MTQIEKLNSQIAALEDMIKDPDFADDKDINESVLASKKKKLSALMASQKEDKPKGTPKPTPKKETTPKPAAKTTTPKRRTTRQTSTGGRKMVFDWKRGVDLEKLKKVGTPKLSEYKTNFTTVTLDKPVKVKTITGDKEIPAGFTMVFLMEDGEYKLMNIHDVPSTLKVLKTKNHDEKKMKEGQVESTPAEKSSKRDYDKPKTSSTTKKTTPTTKRKKRKPLAKTEKGQVKEVEKMDMEEAVDEHVEVIDKSMDKIIATKVTSDKKGQDKIRAAKKKADTLLEKAEKNADTEAEVKMLADTQKNIATVVKQIESGDLEGADAVSKAIEDAAAPLKNVRAETKVNAKSAAKKAKAAVKKATAKRKKTPKKTASTPSAKSGDQPTTKTPKVRANMTTINAWLTKLEINGEYKKTVSSANEIAKVVEDYLADNITPEELDDLVDVTIRMSKLNRVSSRFKKFGKELPAFIYLLVEAYMQNKYDNRIEKVMVMNDDPIVVLELKANSGFRKLSYVGFDLSNGKEINLKSRPSNGSYKVIAVWKESEAKNKGKGTIALESIYNTKDTKSRCDALTGIAKSSYDCLNGRCTDEEKKIVLELSNMCGDLKQKKDARCYNRDLHKIALERYGDGKDKNYGKIFSEVRAEDLAKAKS